MIITKPDYYEEFECIASRCPDSCCSAGWEIGIDEKTLEKYKKVTGPFGNRLHNSIHWKRKSYMQYDKKCIFLSEDKLCDIYTEAGPEMMCKTCKQYPRHKEIYGPDFENTLAISCPEVARIILSRKDKVQFLSYDYAEKKPLNEADKKYLYDDFDEELYGYLVEARKVMLSILQMREYDISTRMGIVLGLAHDLQTRIDQGKLEEIPRILIRYQTPKIMRHMVAKINNVANESKHQGRYDQRFDLMKQYMKLLDSFDTLNIRWEVQRHKVNRILYGASVSNQRGFMNVFHKGLKSTASSEKKEYYTTVVEQFEEFMKQEDWQIVIEQLMVYIVFNYFCTASYDCDAYTKMKLAIYSTVILKEMCFAKWIDQGRRLEIKDMIDFAYRYGREIEHMDQNLNRLEKLLSKRKEFQLENLLLVL